MHAPEDDEPGIYQAVAQINFSQQACSMVPVVVVSYCLVDRNIISMHKPEDDALCNLPSSTNAHTAMQ
jgi:hypothetical protein